MIKPFLNGAIVMAAWVIGVLFIRFQRTTGDRLFGYFAAAFLLLGLERISLEFLAGETQPYVYLIRLVAFLLIVVGILDKNRKSKRT